MTIHEIYIGDNREWLRKIQNKLKNGIDIVYIDPPYGEEKHNKIIERYKNNYTRNELIDLIKQCTLLIYPYLKEDCHFWLHCDYRNNAYFRIALDEIFGSKNFIAELPRKTKTSSNLTQTNFNYQHDTILLYTKNKQKVKFYNRLKDLSKYKNPDNDPNGAWVSAAPCVKSGNMKTGYFAVVNPYTGKKDYPPKGSFWSFSQNTLQDHINAGRICFKKDHKDNERGFIFKRYKKHLKTNYQTVNSLIFCDNKYINAHGTKEIKRINNFNILFPKPTSLIKKILEFKVETNLTIIDFFMGSGTTEAATIMKNKEDGGERKSISIGLNENNIITELAIPRIQQEIQGTEQELKIYA